MILLFPFGQDVTEDTESTSAAQSSTVNEGTAESDVLQEPEETEVCYIIIFFYINMILMFPCWPGCNRGY